MKGLVLIGPPAAGKDTITDIVEQRSNLRLLKKAKAGSGRSAGYRLVSMEEFDECVARGEMVSTVERYGNRYGVMRADVAAIQQAGDIPVIHTASVEEALTLAADGMALCLIWCSRSESADRLRHRDQSTVDERLAVWDQLQDDLDVIAKHLDLVIDTTDQSASAVASTIITAVDALPDHTDVHRQFCAIRPDLATVVPVISPRTHSGHLDVEWFQDHVRRLVEAGCRVLVTGSTGEGDTLSKADRDRLRLAASEVAASRVTHCYWGEDDLRATGVDGSRMVVARSSAEAEALRVEVGQSTMLYSHPRFGYVPSPNQLLGWCGAKLSKLAGAELPAVREVVGRDFALWHGTASSTTTSFHLGADAVVAAELNAFRGRKLPTNPDDFQAMVADIRSRWPLGDRAERVVWLTNQARLSDGGV